MGFKSVSVCVFAGDRRHDTFPGPVHTGIRFHLKTQLSFFMILCGYIFYVSNENGHRTKTHLFRNALQSGNFSWKRRFRVLVLDTWNGIFRKRWRYKVEFQLMPIIFEKFCFLTGFIGYVGTVGKKGEKICGYLWTGKFDSKALLSDRKNGKKAFQTKTRADTCERGYKRYRFSKRLVHRRFHNGDYGSAEY